MSINGYWNGTISDSDENVVEMLHTLRNEMNAKLQILSEKLDQQTYYISQIKSDLVNCIRGQSVMLRRLQWANEDRSRLERLDDVIVKGLPYHPNENLEIIFDQIASIIGFGHSKYAAVKNIHRVAMYKEMPPIIIRFASQTLKERFIQNFFAFGIAIGFMGSIIYLSDNFTKQNYSILKKARQYREAKKIEKIVTQGGFVYVGLQENSQLQKIKTVNQLNQLVLESLEFPGESHDNPN